MSLRGALAAAVGLVVFACKPDDATTARPLNEPSTGTTIATPTAPPAPPPTSAPSSDRPSFADDCVKSDDCGWTTVAADCCAHCGVLVANKASIAARERYCTRHLPSRCPQIDCPFQNLESVCVAGHCRGEPK